MLRYFIFLLLPLSGFCQDYLKGKVLDADSRAAVPFATVAIWKANIGINADERGEFLLEVPTGIKADTLLVSSVGYTTIRVRAGDPVIFLKRNEKVLPEVLVSDKSEWEVVTLNGAGNTSMILSSSGLQVQVAQPFHADVENAWLYRLRFRTETTDSPSPKCMFRLRFYARDTATGAPSEDFFEKPMEIRSEAKWVNVDLEPYHIRIPGKDFFIAVEWLRIPYNEDVRKFRIEKNRTSTTLYKPHLALTAEPSGQLIPWGLDFNGRWFKMSMDKRLAMELTIKY